MNSEARTKDERVHNHASSVEKAACLVCNQENAMIEKDPLDDDIAAQLSAGNLHYMRTLTAIRDRLQALEGRRDNKGIAWLIECSYLGGPTSYYCGPANWCDNPYHAHKFKTRDEAEAVSAPMTTIGERRVSEHSWE